MANSNPNISNSNTLQYLQAIIGDAKRRDEIDRDLKFVLRNLGLTHRTGDVQSAPRVGASFDGGVETGYRQSPANVSFAIMSAIMGARSLDGAENSVHDILIGTTFQTGGTNRLRPRQKTIMAAIASGLSHRAEIIYRQITPFLPRRQTKHQGILDYGAGDCRVAAMIAARDNLRVDACDVADYPGRAKHVPFTLITPQHALLPPDKYTTAIVTNVLHHADDNESVIARLTKLVSRRLIVIETVPVGKTKAALQADAERTFFFDWLYNSGMHPGANIPVPGTYETVAGWKTRFAEHGWNAVHVKNLGRDQPLIPDAHVLYVFDKKRIR